MHVGLEDDDLRIDLMNQLSYFCPRHLLALSASSPFWDGYDYPGLQSYRSVVFEALRVPVSPPRPAAPGAMNMEYIDVSRKPNCTRTKPHQNTPGDSCVPIAQVPDAGIPVSAM